jgi:hypothetical protein
LTVYRNAYKGRANRKESAAHLREEFDRIEAAFATLQNQDTAYIDIYNYGNSTSVSLIDPANGQMQEITLVADTLIQIKNPTSGSDSDSYRLSLMVHGGGYKIINGWGPQTWKENGEDDWLYMFTGGEKASAVLEFAFDGKAWVCAAFTKNNAFDFGDTTPGVGGTENFPFTHNLTSESGATTLTWSRASYGYGLDYDASFVMSPPDSPRYFGARFLKNWIATPKDLQSVAWTENNVTVSTEVGEGQDGGNVDKITFDQTHGELQHWMLMHFGRSSETATPIKFAITFDAKMAGVITSGTCRAVIAIMGVDTGDTVKWDRQSFNLTDSWQSFGAILDPVTGKDSKGFDLTTPAGARTLVKFAIESPSDGAGNPILVENVNVVILKDGDEEKVELPQLSTIGSSLVLAKTSGSTGEWVDGSKTMTLDNGEFVDFQDSLVIGRTYLVALSRVSGNSCDVRLQNDRTFWTAYSTDSGDSTFVKDATFTFQYEGGVCKFFQTKGSGLFTVNMYLVSGEFGTYGTENENSISNGVVTWLAGQSIPSNIAVGVAFEPNTTTNLLATDTHRDFTLWTDVYGGVNQYRGEIGVDSRPSHATLLEDNSTSKTEHLKQVVTIPDDTNYYTFHLFVRKMWNAAGALQVTPEWDGMTSNPSPYMDVRLYLYGGTTPVAGDWVRLSIKKGTRTFTNANSAPDYYATSVFDYTDWWSFFITAINNGTGNTQAELQIIPAPKSSSVSGFSASYRGYCIVDFAQLEDATFRTGTASPGAIPGDPRLPESIATALPDGTLHTQQPLEIGDVTAGVWTFDTINIYKNISWVKT